MTTIRLMNAALATVLAGTVSGTALADSVSDQSSVQAPSTDLGHSGGLFSNSTFEIGTGADYSVGDYGAAADTTVWSIPLDLKLQANRLRLQATLPYVSINGPGQIVGGVIIPSATSTSTTSRNGIGDLNLSAAYLLTHEKGILPSIEVGGGVKLPTASSAIGTGETDFSANASLYKTIAPGVMLFGSAGYSWLGSPVAYRLENGITASGGVNYRPNGDQNFGVSVAYREPVAIGLQGQAVVSPYMTWRLNRRFGLTLYGMAGLNNASPRVGAGFRLSLFR